MKTKAMCTPNGSDLPCYANQKTVAFSSNPNSDYFDLKLSLTGTDLPVSDSAVGRPARKIRGLEVLQLKTANICRFCAREI